MECYSQEMSSLVPVCWHRGWVQDPHHHVDTARGELRGLAATLGCGETGKRAGELHGTPVQTDTFVVLPWDIDVVPTKEDHYILYSFHLCRSVTGVHKPHLNERVLCSVAPTVGKVSLENSFMPSSSCF